MDKLLQYQLNMIETGQLSQCYIYDNNSYGFSKNDYYRVEKALKDGASRKKSLVGNSVSIDVKHIADNCNVSIKNESFYSTKINSFVLAYSEPKRRTVFIDKSIINLMTSLIKKKFTNPYFYRKIADVFIAHELFHVLYTQEFTDDRLEEVGADGFAMELTGIYLPRPFYDMILPELFIKLKNQNVFA